MSNARRASADIIYEHINISNDIAGYVKSLSYTDVASGESDSLTIVLQDKDKNWLGGWFPQKGDHLSTSINFSNWKADGDNFSIYCGEFEIDDVSLSGPPVVCSIGAVSIPRSEAFNETERTKTWENITVREIAAEIAARAAVFLYYEAVEIPVKVIEQDKQTDCKFLYTICQKYGLAMKVFAQKIVIFEECKYEAVTPVLGLLYSDFHTFNYNSTIAGTYTGAKISYTDPGTGEDQELMVGEGSRILEINEEADNVPDAQRKAIAAMNNANKKETVFTGSVMANPVLIAGRCVNISGFGVADGTYYLDRVVTKIGDNGASRQSLTMHRVRNGINNIMPVVNAQLEEIQSGAGEKYIVCKGDTLWEIAQKFLGAPLRYAEIYNLNKNKIEEEAKIRGKINSGNGQWIFPGTELILPMARGDD